MTHAACIFARARVEMKVIECVLHLRRDAPARIPTMLPQHVWDLAVRYGLQPSAQPVSDTADSATRKS